jgi:hypothetical protein
MTGNILVPFIKMSGCEQDSLASLRYEVQAGSDPPGSSIEFSAMFDRNRRAGKKGRFGSLSFLIHAYQC